MTHNTSTMPPNTLNALFPYSQLDAAFETAPILEISSLEDGHDATAPHTLRLGGWRRLIMSVRRRVGTAKDFHAPIRLSENESPTPRSRKSTQRRNLWICVACLSVPVLILCFFGIVHLMNGLSFFLNSIRDDHLNPPIAVLWAQQDRIENGRMSHVPQDLTKNVIPVPCHSHNDYWRKVPLYEALAYGCTGVEADVWLFDDDLLVGHNTNALTTDRTFRSMYVDPLVELLDKQNAVDPLFTPQSSTSLNGVFETKPSQSLIVLVDFKSDGHKIFPHVFEQLYPLRRKNYLTYYDGEKIVSGPITVVATGNAPFDLITSNSTHRDIFFDAPLETMYEATIDDQATEPRAAKVSQFKRTSGQGSVGTDSASYFDWTNSFYASVSFHKSIGHLWWGRASDAQLELIRGQIRGARRRGLKVRYWGTPQWPIHLRNYVWEILLREGVDYLNGDDLQALTREDWGDAWSP